jgi:PAS domain S-box-containing protein
MTEAEIERLRRENALFHLLVNSISDYAIFALDRGGHIASWNPGAALIKGYAATEVIGRHFSLFFAPEDRARGEPERLLRAAREEGRVAAEGWRVRRDGTRFWASVVLSALRAPDGSQPGFAKVTRDLTDRHAAEETLRQRERQLAATQELAQLGSWEWDVAADRVTWTDTLFRIYGLDPDSFSATFEGYLERVHPDDRDRVRGAIERAFQGSDDFEFEERIIRPDGSVRTLRSRGRAIRDAVGATTRLTGACLDITELREAQERAVEAARQSAARSAAEESAARLQFLVQASEVLAASLDYEETLRNVADLAVPYVADWCAVDLIQTDGSLRRVAVAHADPDKVELARGYLAAYPPSRHALSSPWPVIDTGEPEHLADITDEQLAAAVPDAGQLATLRALGMRSAVTVPLVGRSGKLGTLALVQADSGRRLGANDVRLAAELGRHAALAIENAQLHDALRQRTREAELANRAKSEFLAAMSHELRTPLNAIFGYADLIELEVHGTINAEQRESLLRIKRNQRMLLGLINDVLNFAKLEAGRLEITVAALPVHEIVTDLEKVIAPQLVKQGLEYAYHSCPLDVALLGDRERIDQILLNLLTNAIKFTTSGGTVGVYVDCDDAVVRIAVRDTGTGIAADRLEAIFDPFVQIDRHPGQQGVGLGLAISRELAHAMNGTLTADSTPGVGSTFTLTLPRSHRRTEDDTRATDR